MQVPKFYSFILIHNSQATQPDQVQEQVIQIQEGSSAGLGGTTCSYSGPIHDFSFKIQNSPVMFIQSTSYTKHNRVNFHTGGLLGEYEVEGCNGTSPTLVMERDQTYTMVQVSLP